MEVPSLWVVTVWCTISMIMCFMFPAPVDCDPITIDFNYCQPATYPIAPIPNSPLEVIQCCPVKPSKPVIDGPPPPSTNYLRVRKAAQCTDEAYIAKIKQAYALMRALPDDDPRSWSQQWQLHCSYCGASFLTANSTGIVQGIDIHWSWLFFPWHRWYLYFHERILQSLLGDPDFSLNFWNWDNPYTAGDGSSENGACLTKGDAIPFFYDDTSSALYDVNRSDSAKGIGRLNFPDLSYTPLIPASAQLLYNASAEDITQSNLNILYQALVSGGTTPETFLGRAYRAGEPPGTGAPNGGAGAFEEGAHSAVHSWVGSDPINNNLDMGQLSRASRDPVFYSHHSNVDRLFKVWKDIGPILGQNRQYSSDPDFLNAEFLFYDENKDLRRVTVAESLDTEKLGYVYQGANDAPWIFFNASKCSDLSYNDLIAGAESLPSPSVDSEGYYLLEGGQIFTVVVDRPVNPQAVEEFLTIDGVKLDRSWSTGFDVFVDWLNPTESAVPCKCAEYNGRFTSLAQSRAGTEGKADLVWKQSITRTLVDIKAPAAPSKVVITIVPLYQPGNSNVCIKFKSVKVGTD